MENIAKAAFSNYLDTTSMCKLIVEFAVVTAFLETEFIDFPEITATTPMQAHRGDKELALETTRAKDIDEFINVQSATLHIDDAQLAERLSGMEKKTEWFRSCKWWVHEWPTDLERRSHFETPDGLDSTIATRAIQRVATRKPSRRESNLFLHSTFDRQ